MRRFNSYLLGFVEFGNLNVYFAVHRLASTLYSVELISLLSLLVGVRTTMMLDHFEHVRLDPHKLKLETHHV